MQVSRGETNNENLSLLRMLNPEVLADPYAHYRALREYDPVHWDPYMHAWVVTSYPEAVTVLMNYSADRTPAPAYLDRLGLSFMKPFAEVMMRQMMFMDGASHARLRGICSAAFTPRRVEGLRTVIESIADELIDKVIASGKMDMIADFANPLPAIVTARLLGVPIEDHEKLHAWVLDLAEVLGNFQHHPERVAQIVQSLEDLKSYVAARMEEQRRRPNSGLIYSLMTAEVDGHKLSDEEVIANTIITLIGGHETTTNLIASGFLTLLRNPESFQQLEALRKSLAPQLRSCCASSRPFNTPPALHPPRWSLVERRSKRDPELWRFSLRRTATRIVSRIRTVWICFGPTTGTWLLAGLLIFVSAPHWLAWRAKSLSPHFCAGFPGPL